MLAEFFTRVNPDSTMAKPAFIKNTNAAPIRNQIPNDNSAKSIYPPIKK
jgi:hypothetical protein